MITTAEYLREKERADVAEAKIKELEAKILQYEQINEEKKDLPSDDLDTDF